MHEEFASPGGGSGAYVLSSWLFLRLLGLSYLAAFVSLAVQIKGLAGRRGILPARDYLLARRTCGPTRFLQYPTLCWWNAGDRFLVFLCRCGVVLAALLVLGVAPLPILMLLWGFYLSLFTVCRVFLGYQWDVLLLETGFLAIFIAPITLLPEFPPSTAPSKLVLWLLWWLLFRLMFSSGFVKLRGGDKSWRTLTALRRHYETQPLPTRTAWHMHQLPPRFHRFSALFMFAVELLMPVFIFAPPPFCYLAGGSFILLMLLIMATGNYAFFNLLAIALSVLLFDDFFWISLAGECLPEIQLVWAAAGASSWRTFICIPVALIIGLLSVEVVCRLFRVSRPWPRPMERLIEWLDPFRLVNGYGLFAVMTTERPEIIVEGSHDGVHWKEYEFKWKPGDVNRAPRFVAPHQPRLDWQMWFAALSPYAGAPWFGRFLLCLLQGSSDARALLRMNPFAEDPPRFVRAVLYDYHFTNRATRRATGAWWRRDRRGLYGPVLSRRDETAG